nr:DMT family transporter [Collibacillus ludicampi]
MKTEFLLMGVVLVWGANYTVSKYGILELTPEMFTFLRFAIVFPLLLLAVLWKERSLAIERRDILRLVFTGLVGIAIYQTLFMTSVKYTSATHSSLMIALSPIFTGILAIIGGQEKFTWRVQAGSLISFLGAAAVIGLGDEGVSFYSRSFFGDMMGLLAAFFWGWYPVLAAPLVRKYSSLRVTAWSSVVGVLALLLMNIHQFSRTSWHWHVMTWASLFYSAILVTVYGLVAWYYGVSQIGPTKVMVYMYAIPLVAILVAAGVLHEAINSWQIIGALVILAGITIVKTEGKRNAAVSTHPSMGRGRREL